MKKVLASIAIISFLGVSNVTYAADLDIHSSPSMAELKVAAEIAGVEIRENRPIAYGDYVEILQAYVVILEELIKSKGWIPVTQIR